jgi:hypothetical protein
LRFIGVFLGVLRLEVSIYNVYITNQFHTTVAQGERGKLNPLVEVTVNSKEGNSLSQSRSRIRPLASESPKLEKGRRKITVTIFIRESDNLTG